MMEYLEIRGAVKLRADANKSLVKFVLRKLLETEFVDEGYISISLENDILSISAEGTISDRFSIIALLKVLQSQLIETSMICVSSVRWEILVVLKYVEPVAANRLELHLADVQ